MTMTINIILTHSHRKINAWKHSSYHFNFITASIPIPIWSNFPWTSYSTIKFILKYYKQKLKIIKFLLSSMRVYKKNYIKSNQVPYKSPSWCFIDNNKITIHVCIAWVILAKELHALKQSKRQGPRFLNYKTETQCNIELQFNSTTKIFTIQLEVFCIFIHGLLIKIQVNKITLILFCFVFYCYCSYASLNRPEFDIEF